ncbi:hypothetical protein ABEB36_012096 [Hypothenemus hampei]|uniref:Uncharacterized protein n=1 Tax=Hypothenemus hampei TaxID=57062 RepID=A0ABD1EA44_HYPHA
MEMSADTSEKMATSNVSPNVVLEVNDSSPEFEIQPQILIKTEFLEKLEIDLSVKCRGCFTEDPEMYYLYTVFDQQLNLADILRQTTNIECEKDDGFPPYLCAKCTSCIVDFFNFKIQYQKTELYIKTLLEKDDFKVNTPEENISSTDSSSNEESNQTFTEVKIRDDLTDVKKLIEVPPGICQLCQEEFSSGIELENHEVKEHGKNPFTKYDVFRNLIVASEKASLQERKRARLKKYHLKKDALMNLPGKLCRICKAKVQEEEFQMHWDSHKINICEDCGYRCIKTADLKIHRASVHSEERNFKCGLCEKSFKTKPLFRKHQLVHSNPRSYCCEVCGQRFNDSGILKTHIQLKHIRSRNFICPICGLSFPMKSTLDRHIVRHNKNRPPKFFCDICSSPFRDKSSLNRHRLVKHSTDYVRPACELCDKTYSSKTKLKFHMERHHSEDLWRKKGDNGQIIEIIGIEDDDGGSSSDEDMTDSEEISDNEKVTI